MAQRRRSIEVWRKLEVIDWIEVHGEGKPTRAAAHFAKEGWYLDPAVCRKWWRQRERLRATTPTHKRLSGAGRKTALGDVEDLLLDMIVRRRTAKEKVTRAWIAVQARYLYGEVNGPEMTASFDASPKWVSNFMKRMGLSLRRRTNLTVLTDTVLVNRAIEYMKFLHEFKQRVTWDHTILMDETAVSFEDSRTQTVDWQGARHVVMRSTGFASMRITAILAFTASGRKMTPVLIWKHKKGTGTIVRRSGVWIAYQPKAWVDSNLLCNWLDVVFPTVLQAEKKGIVWDSMRAHISKQVKEKCSSRGIDMCVVPGGLTPYLQAGDIGVYKSFKDILCEMIDAWKTSSDVQYTRNGNPRPPSEETVAGWVANAWRRTPDLVIDSSIRAAGFDPSHMEWHIACHDVYGPMFQTQWEAARVPQEDMNLPATGDYAEEDQCDSLCDALDEIDIIDE